MEPIPYAHLQLTTRRLSAQIHHSRWVSQPSPGDEEPKCQRREERRNEDSHHPDVQLNVIHQVQLING